MLGSCSTTASEDPITTCQAPYPVSYCLCTWNGNILRMIDLKKEWGESHLGQLYKLLLYMWFDCFQNVRVPVNVLDLSHHHFVCQSISPLCCMESNVKYSSVLELSVSMSSNKICPCLLLKFVHWENVRFELLLTIRVDCCTLSLITLVRCSALIWRDYGYRVRFISSDICNRPYKVSWWNIN